MREKIKFSTRRVLASILAMLISIAPAATSVVAYADENETIPVMETNSDSIQSETKPVLQDTQEEPTVSENAEGEGVTEGPTAGEDPKGEGVTEEPTAGETTKGEEVTEGPTAGENAEGEGVTEEPTAGETTKGEEVTEEPTAGENSKGEGVTEGPTVGEDPKGEGVTEEPTVSENTKGEGVTEEPTAGETTNGEGVTEEPIVEEKVQSKNVNFLRATASLDTESPKSTPGEDFDFADGLIKEYTGSDEDVIIPSKINEEDVTKIASYAFDFTSVTSVTIPKSITKICAEAIGQPIEEVKFQGELPEFEEFPFTEYVYDVVFSCHIDYEEDYEKALDYYLNDNGCTLETFGEPSNPEEPKPVDPYAGLTFEAVGEDGFKIASYTGEGGDVVIPDTYKDKPIVAIGNNAFDPNGNGFSKITSITMPDTVTSIEDWAFNDCIKMETIKLSNNLETIGENAFQYCNSLKEISVPQSVTEIKDLAFTMCEELENINIEDGNSNYKDIDGVLVNKDGKVLINYPAGRTASEYNVPEGIELIKADAFKLYYGNKTSALTSVTFPSTLKEIGDRAFMQTKLENITISPGIKIGEGAFELCKNAKTVIVQEGVTKIEANMLYALENCETIKLPSTLKEIGYRAFDRLSLTSIELPEGLEVIGEEAFECSKLTSITIPASVKTIGPRAFYLSRDLKEINFKEGSEIKSIGQYAFNSCKTLETVNLPNSVNTLEDGAFSHCYALESINLPNSLTTLENCVFSGSALKEITLPDNIKNIGSCTFRDCPDITEIKMPANLEALGICTFENCQNLTKVNFPESIKLSYIPEDTFFDCRTIKHIYLPKAITETKACEFSNCKNNPVIEHANKNLKRSVFDCYAVDPGDSYEIRGDVYWLIADVVKEDDTTYEELKSISKETEGENGSIIKSRSALGQESLCGCSMPANAAIYPTSNPTFKYKPALSGESDFSSTRSSRKKHRSHNWENGTTGTWEQAPNTAVTQPQTDTVTPPLFEKPSEKSIPQIVSPKLSQSPDLQISTENKDIKGEPIEIPVSTVPSVDTTNIENTQLPLIISITIGIGAISAGSCTYILRARKRKLNFIETNK